MCTLAWTIDDGARRARQVGFARLAAAAGPLDVARLAAFHRSHAPSRGLYSARMHRNDAATVSLAPASVRPDAMALWYAGESPRETLFGAPLCLARRA